MIWVRILVPVLRNILLEIRRLQDENNLKKVILSEHIYNILKTEPRKGVCGIMAKFGTYIQEAYDELVHKVTWPTWEELQQTTIIVLVSLIIVTLVIFGMDFASEKVMTLLYNILGK